MSYPKFGIEVYDYVQQAWIPTHARFSNEPHYYDTLRPQFERWVASARQGSANQQPIGYRIVAVYNDGQRAIYDTWTNGKVPE